MSKKATRISYPPPTPEDTNEAVRIEHMPKATTTDHAHRIIAGVRLANKDWNNFGGLGYANDANQRVLIDYITVLERENQHLRETLQHRIAELEKQHEADIEALYLTDQEQKYG